MTPGYVVTVTRPCKNCAGEGGYERIAEDTGEPFPAKCDEPGCNDGAMRVSRQKADALDDARHRADEAVATAYARDRLEDWEVPQGYYDASWTARTLPAGGGSIGLPDGSTISVERVEDDGEGR